MKTNTTMDAATTTTAKEMPFGDGSPLDGEARLGGKPNLSDKMPLGGYPHQNDISPFGDDAHPSAGKFEGCLIVTSFDVTFHTANPYQYKVNLGIAQEFRDGGGKFCIATDRSLESLWEHPEAVSLCDFVIALDGAALYCRDVPLRDRLSFSAIYTAPLDRDILASFYHEVEKSGLDINPIFMSEDEESPNSCGDGDLLKVRLWCRDLETMDAVMAKAKKYRELSAYAHLLTSAEVNSDTERLPWVEARQYMVDITDANRGNKGRAVQELVKKAGASTTTTVGSAQSDLGLIMSYQGYAVNPSWALKGWVPEKRTLTSFSSLFVVAPELQIH